MRNRTTSRIGRKAKKSYTLSPAAVAFVESVRRRRHIDSVSAALELILEEARKDDERAATDRAIGEYYSGLTEKELAEQREWSKFALRQMTSGVDKA